MSRTPSISAMGSALRSRIRSHSHDTLPDPFFSDPDENRSIPSTPAPPPPPPPPPSPQRFELQDDPAFWKDHNVQVVIRIRPLSGTEISLQGYNNCVRQDSCQTLTWTGHPENRFTFDLVADEHVSQENLFKVAGVPMAENCVAGYNSCMFAYGQTGSGKTHTMLGDIEGGTRRHSVNCGMTPRVFEHLFSRIQKEREARRDEKLQFTCRCSFLEIYNEQILDLLDPNSVNLQIREDLKKGIHVENLTEIEVSCARDVMQQLIQGAANRKVAATNMNRASSRSHSVFTCVIESKWESQGVTHHRFARLNLVDLAGSERQKSSGAEGERLKEATNINKSLSTLGLVIMNLVGSSKKSQHVPYRDSKLTFLLQDSLGGNSKTTIIANISPSNCCALETLSTLKFAQRAKFIRNNAIVNEDASGDVLAMRLQIQQLKKEVTRLRGLANGEAENPETGGMTAFCPPSPLSFKWDGGQGSFSPLTVDKKLSQRKEYDAALVAAFRRDREKEAELKALAAGKHNAEQLATQKEEEVRSLKMILKFREEGIKRLQAVASGKLSAHSHLLQEKEELLKEMEILRNQVDRNPEVNRFARENLQLQEEVRRLQSFVEEGEREMMNEQITLLQDKLLEALDWKLMHEKDSETVKDLSLSWESSANEENEFLRLQAIQNQREADALRRNLSFCLEAKEKLERRVDDLVRQLEEQRKLNDTRSEEVRHLRTSSSSASGTNDLPDKHAELQTMVEAIAAASQREAEAHETAIILSKEIEELRMRLKVLIEDNNRLSELYETAVAERTAGQAQSSVPMESVDYEGNVLVDIDGDDHLHSETKDVEHLERQLQEMHEENDKLLGLYEKAMQERKETKDVEHLEHQLQEMQEENDKLLGLYEKAMQERKETKDVEHLEHQLQEMHEENDKLLGLYEKAMQERKKTKDVEHLEHQLQEIHEENDKLLGLYEKAMQERDEFKRMLFSNEHTDKAKEELYSAEQLVAADEEGISCMQDNENFSSAKREAEEQNVRLKQQEIAALQLALTDIQGRKTITENKFTALKTALNCFSSNAHYWDEREGKARAMVESYLVSLEQKKEELRHLQIRKDKIDTTYTKARQSESGLRTKISHLKLKFQDAAAQRKESERVLFAIDNLNFGKASELLKSEEERTKMTGEMKQLREQLVTAQKDMASSIKMSEALDTMIKSLEAGIESGSSWLMEAELTFERVLEEKELLSTMREQARNELGRLLVDYQECVFGSYLKEGEIQLCNES